MFLENAREKEMTTRKNKNLAVYIEDYEYIRTWAYNNNTTMVSTISILVEELKKASINKRKEIVKLMYFLNEEHRHNFATFLDEQFHMKNEHEYLVAFYVNAIPTINPRNYNRRAKPFEWTGRNDKKQEGFVPSELYLTLSSGDQQIVNLAKNLFNSSNEFNLNEGLKEVDASYLPLIQEMIRLSLLGIPRIETDRSEVFK